MKRLIFLLCLMFVETFVWAQTVNLNWYIDDNVYTTTSCESGDDLTPPTPPEKPGYTFQGWVPYIQLEYLDKNGSAFIDTGYFANKKTSIKTKVKQLANAVYFFGCTNTNQAQAFTAYGWDTLQFTRYSGYNTGIRFGNGDLVEIDWDKDIIKYSVNGDTFQTIQTNNNISFECLYSMYLFAEHRFAGGYGGSRARIYYFQIYDDDVLVYDFIPVIDGAGTPCMYDKVGEKFYYNAGTGNFIAGPIIND